MTELEGKMERGHTKIAGSKFTNGIMCSPPTGRKKLKQRSYCGSKQVFTVALVNENVVPTQRQVKLLRDCDKFTQQLLTQYHIHSLLVPHIDLLVPQ